VKTPTWGAVLIAMFIAALFSVGVARAVLVWIVPSTDEYKITGAPGYTYLKSAEEILLVAQDGEQVVGPRILGLSVRSGILYVAHRPPLKPGHSIHSDSTWSQRCEVIAFNVETKKRIELLASHEESPVHCGSIVRTR
jgi:hypothetical protein